MEKIDLRMASTEEKVAIRKLAIKLYKQGHTKIEISRILEVNKNSVVSWCQKFESSGIKGLKEAPRGHKLGEGRLLQKEQEKQIQKWITDKMPDQLKLPFGLWTRKAIVELIKREYGIKVAERTMGDYLNRWCFTPQKPKKKAYEQNSKLVQKWLKEEYPKIKERVKKEGGVIHWGDETGVRNDCQHGRSYAPKGKTPIKMKMSKRISMNMISTVTNQGLVRFMIYKGTMNSQCLITFMRRLIKGSKKKVFLILDNLRVHHSRLVKEWIEGNKGKIALYYLPSYSPEMNPDEYLNCDLKNGLSHRPSPKDENQLKKNINSHMRLLQNNPDRVSKYFNHKSINYAAA